MSARHSWAGPRTHRQLKNGPAQAVALGVLKMEYSEDLAYTSRRYQIIGMLSLVVADLLVTLDTPGTYINLGV